MKKTLLIGAILAITTTFAQSPPPITVVKTEDIVPLTLLPPEQNPRIVSFSTEDEEILYLHIETNIITQWMPLRQISTNGVRSLGFLVTNRVAYLVHDDKTNAIILKVLGQEEFPSQKGTNLVSVNSPASRNGIQQRRN